MEVIKKVLQKNDGVKEINYTLIETGSNAVCFMFSGAGYTYDKPLFYYATMTMLQYKIDIVHIHYSYEKEIFNQPFERITQIIMDDIDPVIFQVLKNKQYTETLFLGKSLGTIPIVNEIMKRDKYLNSKMILLTPLLKFEDIFEAIMNSKHQGLLVIGDKDHHYNLKKLVQLEKTNFNIEIIQNANHSLDIEENETTKSISTLLHVMEKMQAMMKTIL